MTDQEAQKLAEEHWNWIEPLLRLCGIGDEELRRTKYLFITGGVHMVKHEREAKNE